MTDKKDFKRLIRERMDKTGESYTAALKHFRENPARPGAVDLLAQWDAEEEAFVAQQVEELGIRVIHEASGRWAARTNDYPNLVEYGATAEDAKRRLVHLISGMNEGWQDQLDSETVDYIGLQDGD